MEPLIMAVVLIAALAIREVQAREERRDWARERGELLNRLQFPEVRTFVPPIVTPIVKPPQLPADDIDAPDAWDGEVGVYSPQGES